MVRIPAPHPPLNATARLVDGLASVRLAVVLMAILATCIWAMFYEVSHGTDAVRNSNWWHATKPALLTR